MTHPFSATAMVLAAGLGTRMRPLTDAKPKPLLLVGGKTMLDHALDRLIGVGIKRAVVNVFYLAEQIEQHLKARNDIEIVISRETELLDTGGGIANVLSAFEDKPFFALNADLPWIDGAVPSLTHMMQTWQPDDMDALLLLMRTNKARGFQSSGDFMRGLDGRIWRKNTQPPRDFVYIGAQILKPDLFAAPPAKIFSNNHVFNLAEARDRLYGVEHGGSCFHVGTPGDWRLANELLASGAGWGV
jgi:MurNAc alpha-1-phosphate uridylyltransferase